MRLAPSSLGIAAMTVAIAVPASIASVAAWGGAMAYGDPLAPEMSQVDNLIAVVRDHAEARGVEASVISSLDVRGQRTLDNVTWPVGPNPVLVPREGPEREGFSFEHDAGYSFDEEMARDDGFAFDSEPLPEGTSLMPPIDGGVW